MCVVGRKIEYIADPTAGDDLFRVCKGGPRAADMPCGSFLVRMLKHGDAKCPALLNGEARRRLTKDVLALHPSTQAAVPHEGSAVCTD